MERDILHLTVPTFPITLARIAEPSLRERPVAVAPLTSERAVIQCASLEARAEGVCEGVSVYQARRFCPSLVLLSPRPETVARGMAALLQLSSSFSPVCEAASAGQIFLDLTGCRKLFGPGRDAAARLDREVASTLSLPALVGVAGNKLVAKIAGSYLHRPGVCDVLRGAERPFLAPLPVSVLPGVGEIRREVLMRDLNLRRVEEIAALSPAQLKLAFGPFAPLLHQRANGIDPSPVQPPRRTPEIREEAFLPREENDDALLLAELCRLAEGCGMRLRRLGQEAARLTLTVAYADGPLVQRTAPLPTPLNHDLLLFESAEKLFSQATERRVRIKGLSLACSRLSGESGQLDLFADPRTPTPRQIALQEALDRLRSRFGPNAVRWGRTLAV